MFAGDEGIMMTNDESTNSKRAAIKLGYWKDDYIDLFSRGSPRVERKTPEINRGYFARVYAIDQTVDHLLSQLDANEQKCQIVNLGAGFDSLFWRIHNKFSCLRSFVDVDLPGVTSRKVMHIRHRTQLLSALGDDIQYNSLALQSSIYHLVPCDLRKQDDLEKKLLSDCKLDPSIATIFLAECVLIYMDVINSNNLLSWISSHFNQTVFINYEQINIFDRFGQIMVENLKQRSFELLDLESCRSIESQQNRFTNNGWQSAEAWDMFHIYRQLIPHSQIERIEKIEFLDEANLLEQLLTHYCIVIAKKGLPELSINFSNSPTK